jgi:hypothetical protein
MFLRYTMSELLPTRQLKGDPPRRWFASPGADLIVWLRDDGSLHGFQFCYDKEYDEHALTWMDACGYSHMAVDTGSAFGWGSGTPLLVPNGVVRADRVLELFQSEAVLLPPELARFVEEKLLAFAEKTRAS